MVFPTPPFWLATAMTCMALREAQPLLAPVAPEGHRTRSRAAGLAPAVTERREMGRLPQDGTPAVRLATGATPREARGNGPSRRVLPRPHGRGSDRRPCSRRSILRPPLGYGRPESTQIIRRIRFISSPHRIRPRAPLPLDRQARRGEDGQSGALLVAERDMADPQHLVVGGLLVEADELGEGGDRGPGGRRAWARWASGGRAWPGSCPGFRTWRWCSGRYVMNTGLAKMSR